jgi:hypothetical protein
MERGQSTVIGFILITAIAIVIISVTLFWAAPLVEQSNAQLELQRLEQKFLELHRTVEKVAGEQGQLSMEFNIERGTLSLDPDDDDGIATSFENNIVYKGQLDLQSVIPCKSLLEPITCNNILVEGVGEGGIVGENESAWLVERGAVEFILHYRLMQSDDECHRIKLVPGEQTTAGAGRHTIFLTWLQENVTGAPTPSGCGGLAPLRDQIVEFNIE